MSKFRDFSHYFLLHNDLFNLNLSQFETWKMALFGGKTTLKTWKMDIWQLEKNLTKPENTWKTTPEILWQP